MRALALLVLVSCTGGGEGDVNAEATVRVQAISCELPDPMTMTTRATLAVFMRDAYELSVFASSDVFGLGGQATTTNGFDCGDWSATEASCTRGPDDPAHATLVFTSTSSFDFELPAIVSVAVHASVVQDVGNNAAADSADAGCR